MSSATPQLAVIQAAAVVKAKRKGKTITTATVSSSSQCQQCHQLLSTAPGPHISVTVDGHCATYHASCVPSAAVLAVCPSADYSAAVQHWPSRDPLLTQLTATFDRLLLTAHQRAQMAFSSAAWWRDPELFVDQAAAARLTCAVCQHILHEPVELPCEGAHLLCKPCWTVLRLGLAGGSLSRQLPCPYCREALDVSRAQPSRVIERMIEHELQLRCRAHDEGCTATMAMGKRGAHCIEHDERCLPTACSDCSAVMPKRRMEQHRMTDCLFTCPACGEQVPCGQRYQHMQALPTQEGDEQQQRKEATSSTEPPLPPLCVNTQLCPNRCAQPVVLRSDFDEHLRLLCPYRLIRCHDLHCVKLHRYNELMQDVRDNMEEVYSNIVAELRDCSARAEDLEAEVQELRADNAKLHTQVQGAVQAINNTQDMVVTVMKQRDEFRAAVDAANTTAPAAAAATAASSASATAATSAAPASPPPPSSSSSPAPSKKEKKLQAKLAKLEKAREREEDRLRAALVEKTTELREVQEQGAEVRRLLDNSVEQLQKSMGFLPYPSTSPSQERWSVLMDVVRQQVTDFRQVLVILTGLLGGVGRVSISECEAKVDRWVVDGCEKGWTAHMSMWLAAVRELTSSGEWKEQLNAIEPAQRTPQQTQWVELARAHSAFIARQTGTSVSNE